MAEDLASCAITAAVAAMKEAFTAESPQPPLGGGSSKVRFFAGDAAPLAAWDAHRSECECDEAFLWVRLMRRYRTQNFPTPYVGPDPCGAPIAIALEVGVGRCASMSLEDCGWTEYENEAEISLDDSWRIELALCRAAGKMKQEHCADLTAIDAVLPFGPEGGVIAWVGTMYVQLAG